MSFTHQRWLDRKTKELLFTVVLIALGTATEHVKARTEVAKREGATKKEVFEPLEMLGMPCDALQLMLGYEAWRASFLVRRAEQDQP